MNSTFLRSGNPFFDTASTAMPPTSAFGLIRVSVPSRTATFEARMKPAP
jgi:hypothetical protein